MLTCSAQTVLLGSDLQRVFEIVRGGTWQQLEGCAAPQVEEVMAAAKAQAAADAAHAAASKGSASTPSKKGAPCGACQNSICMPLLSWAAVEHALHDWRTVQSE